MEIHILTSLIVPAAHLGKLLILRKEKTGKKYGQKSPKPKEKKVKNGKVPKEVTTNSRCVRYDFAWVKWM